MTQTDKVKKVVRRSVEAGLPGLRVGLSSMPARLFAVSAALLSVGLGVLASSQAPATASPAGRPPDVAQAFKPAPDAPAPRLVRLPSDRLHLPSLGEAVPLRRDPTLKPAALCKAIEIGPVSTGWLESPVYPGEWECLSMEEPPAAGARKTGRPKPGAAANAQAPDDVSLFAMARGSGEDRVGYVRFKMSGSGETALDRGAEALADRVAVLFGSLNWTLPERVPLSIRMLQPFEIEVGGTTIRLAKEVLTEGRYNLIITFPQRKADAMPHDARELLPPGAAKAL